MSGIILPFARIAAADAALVGAKAFNLARLTRLGLPVPPGFCVVAPAYRQHLADHELVPKVKATVAAARAQEGLAQPDEVGASSRKARVLTELREAIIAAPLTVEFRLAIEPVFQALDANRIAVRSSSTVEDLPGLSFAGLYDTVLLKTDLWGCLNAIKSCWASLWTERAFDYREKNRVDHFNAGMAVIVQKMIPSEVSGIVFTADPVSGAKDRVIVEAVYGLGEGIVSGKVAPDRFVLYTRMGTRSRIVSPAPRTERAIARKATQVVFSEQWGVREWPVPDEQQQLPCIDDALARQLAKHALAVERAFGAPQDIEWARRGAEIAFLQARPITTLAPGRLWEERQVWTNVNLAEAVPEAIPPATQSLVDIFVKGIFGWLLKLSGIQLEDIRITDMIAGRPYINLNTFIGIVRNIPFLNRMRLSELFGGLKDELAPKPEDVADIKVNRLKILLGLPGFIIWFLANQPERGRRAVAELALETDRLQRQDFAQWSEEELQKQATFAFEEILTHADKLGGAMVGMQYYSMLFSVGRKWFNDPESTVASHLLTSLGDIVSAQAGLELWRLADLAAARPALEALIRSDEKWEQLRPKLSGVELGDEFLKRWDELMFRHGHHCRGEFDVTKPRWRDQPDFVLETIRSFLRAGSSMNPEQEFRARVAEREQFTAECRRRLRNPFKRLIFGFLLKRAQAGASIRENLRNEANRRIAIGRMVMLLLGDRFARRGIIAERDDVFFLCQHELGPVQKGVQSFDVRNTISDRKAEYQRNLNITPPPVIVGRFNADDFQPEPIDENAETLSGLAVSPGVVTGRARVIMRYSHDEQVLPGEILVAPFTDPGWTPYFLPAAGIVVDIGGLLSHGSIVAREYGKPAVVNVGPATRIIKTGQMIQVDGNQGKVRILR
jgi:pyruvate,water dikinase